MGEYGVFNINLVNALPIKFGKMMRASLPKYLALMEDSGIKIFMLVNAP